MDADRAFARVDQAGDEFAHRAGAVVIGDVDRLDRRAGRLDRQHIRDRGQCGAIMQFELRAKAMNAGHWINSLYQGERGRSEEHTSELQSLMRISYAVFYLKKKTTT